MSHDASALARRPGSAHRDALARHPVGRSGEPAGCSAVDGGRTAASPVHPAPF
ncbi:hypothetical protein [Modestobacter sp. URMC 112]